MKLKHLSILISIVLIVSTIGFAGTTDSVRARLKSGARIRGTIQSSNSGGITINVDGIGNTEFDWSDITYLSSTSVYDSLIAEKAFIVLPAPVSSRSVLEKYISGNIYFGYALNNGRGFGFGAQAQFATEHFFAGLIGVIHFGSASQRNSSFTYLGPQIGGIFSFGDVAIKPVLSYGQAQFNSIIAYNAVDATAACFSPGLMINADVGFTKIGVQYRYFNFESNKFSGLYLLFGQ